MSKLTLNETNLSNKRELQETYQEYRKRMRDNYYKVKYYLKGEIIWDSKDKGTLNKQKK